MSKATILDRLAGAMETLGKREGKALTPRQRVAAAQRWNSLAGIGEDEAGRLYRRAEKNATQPGVPNQDDLGEWGDFNDALSEMGIRERGVGFRADNPFLSDNIDKYAEQSDFLDWCRSNRVEPNARSLKQFRWETYQTLPQRERQWIANKDAVRQSVRDEGFVSPHADDLRTLQDLDDATLDYTGSKYDFMELPTYNSYEEFPDNFDHMWRY